MYWANSNSNNFGHEDRIKANVCDWNFSSTSSTSSTSIRRCVICWHKERKFRSSARSKKKERRAFSSRTMEKINDDTCQTMTKKFLIQVSQWHGVQLRISASGDDLFDWIRFHSHLMDLIVKTRESLGTQAWQHFVSCWAQITAAWFGRRYTRQIKVASVEKITREAIQSWMNIGKKVQNIHHRQFLEDQQKNFIRQIEQMTTIRHFSHMVILHRIGTMSRDKDDQAQIGLGKDSLTNGMSIRHEGGRAGGMKWWTQQRSPTRTPWEYKKLVFIFPYNYFMKKKKRSGNVFSLQRSSKPFRYQVRKPEVKPSW